MLALPDEIGGEGDAEPPGDEEPSLVATIALTATISKNSTMVPSPNVDGEPSLRITSSEGHFMGDDRDLEEEHQGNEPFDQSRWGFGSRSYREGDAAEGPEVDHERALL